METNILINQEHLQLQFPEENSLKVSYTKKHCILGAVCHHKDFHPKHFLFHQSESVIDSHRSNLDHPGCTGVGGDGFF